LEVNILSRINQLVEQLTGNKEAATPPATFHIESVQLVFQPKQRTNEPFASLIPLSWKLTPRQKLAVQEAWDLIVGSQAGAPEHPLNVLDRYFERRL
jgi:hypothetical protein